MFIQTETTPNPLTMKFLPGTTLLAKGTLNFTSPEEARVSPLARRLFDIDGVTGVFVCDDFVTVTRDRAHAWETLKPVVLGSIMDHLTSGQAVVDEAALEQAAGADHTDPIVVKIVDLLETRVRPAVAQDGGDIVFRGFEDGVVYLHMQGSCSGCPSSTATLKHGIENMLRYYVPEVHEVRAVDW